MVGKNADFVHNKERILGREPHIQPNFSMMFLGSTSSSTARMGRVRSTCIVGTVCGHNHRGDGR